MPYRRKKLTFAISSPDEFLFVRMTCSYRFGPKSLLAKHVNMHCARADPEIWIGGREEVGSEEGAVPLPSGGPENF